MNMPKRASRHQAMRASRGRFGVLDGGDGVVGGLRDGFAVLQLGQGHGGEGDQGSDGKQATDDFHDESLDWNGGE